MPTSCVCGVIWFIFIKLKVVELSDALESSGSYSKAEISERVSKFRDKLMQVRIVFFEKIYCNVHCNLYISF